MEDFVISQMQQNKEFMNQNVHTNELIKQLEKKVNVMATHNKMLKNQISQVAHQHAVMLPQLEFFLASHNPTQRDTLMSSHYTVVRN